MSDSRTAHKKIPPFTVDLGVNKTAIFSLDKKFAVRYVSFYQEALKGRPIPPTGKAQGTMTVVPWALVFPGIWFALPDLIIHTEPY